tara:strand:+ start:4701 stop:5300 length:600 start_codon:yes stop_codon:yes gene_type:complete
MSFSRINYDESAYDLQMERSKGPGDYRLFPNVGEHCKQVYPYNDPTNAKSQVSLVKKDDDLTYGEMANVENLLTNRVKHLQNGNLEGKNDEHKKIPVHHKQNANTYLEMEDTRFTNPIDTYRGMSLTSFFFTPYLHVNPQCKVQSIKNKFGSSSRLIVKDSYNVPDQSAWDSGKGLPPKLGDPAITKENKKCKYVCDEN